jgi:hypothetical protein
MFDVPAAKFRFADASSPFLVSWCHGYCELQ